MLEKNEGDDLLNQEYLQVLISPQIGEGSMGHRDQWEEGWWCMAVAQCGEKCPCSR